MRLVSSPDNVVNYKDRALWLTSPFDLNLNSVSPPVVVTPTEYRYNTVFAGIYGLLLEDTEQAKAIRNRTSDRITSGFNSENINFPYINITHLGTSFDELNSCFRRYESETYLISVFSYNLQETRELFELLYDLYDTTSFIVRRKTVLSLFWNTTEIIEIEPGIWRATNSIDLEIEKKLTTNYINTQTTSVAFFTAIFARFSQFTDLNKLVSGFYYKYGIENITYPYICLESFNFDEDYRHSCGRINLETLTFCIYSYTLTELENIIDVFQDVYDYSVFIINQRNSIIFEWQSTKITEIEPGIWEAKLVYNMKTESLYTDLGGVITGIVNQQHPPNQIIQPPVQGGGGGN